MTNQYDRSVHFARIGQQSFQLLGMHTDSHRDVVTPLRGCSRNVSSDGYKVSSPAVPCHATHYSLFNSCGTAL